MRVTSVIGIVLVALMALGDVTVGAQEASPDVAPDGESPTVTVTREVVFAGRYFSMSPDGKWIATFDSEENRLCALDAASLGQNVTSPDGDELHRCV